MQIILLISLKKKIKVIKHDKLCKKECHFPDVVRPLEAMALTDSARSEREFENPDISLEYESDGTKNGMCEGS